ncbi:flavoprotein [Microlunatus soli]|uniref:Flavoprotein n=1 Tax=Microlunatus soli TaxID=630515 RepID=A0A1H1XPN0_9ACTN|nr:flavoprotein [Microlunatus soli]SDT11021.1 Flavoprotein [Microlunatus soli]
MPHLTIVTCGAPLAARTADLTTAAVDRGWEVAYAVTESSRAWLTDVDLGDSGFRRPDQPKRPRPDAVIVLPLTFNTGSKWALGIADNRPLSLLCESLGAGLPIAAVPLVNRSLWGHPAWAGHLDVLTGAGVVLIDPLTGHRDAGPVTSDHTDGLVASFDPRWLLDALPGRD